jgi:membrane protein DedA with SNARE-associated domain
MSIESIDIPLPSEIILLYAAISLTYSLDFPAVVLVGTSACLTGSLVTYVIAFFGGNYLFERYGKYLGITHRELRVTISGLTDMERSPFLSAEWF